MGDGEAFGLCSRCAHQKLVANTRGSSFSMCLLARRDSRFPKYPRVPVARCDGFSPRDADGPRAA
ncbi:MAG: hypothetical protein KGR19_10580 [Acidobacteria bacterium]|nr:hypothetical protein [Acidobacteriota bacterium]